MTTELEKTPRQMPKGGRKGGSVFPRLPLLDAISYARKLVSKTHTGAQPRDIILSGVMGSKSGSGNVRLSALRQYGFLKGDTKSNFSADDLAKKIAAAPNEELVPLYQQAMLKPTVFRKLFDTFHGDTISKAKLKQRAADLDVHPDETANCVDLYIAGMTAAELVTVDGDMVTHVASRGATVTADQSHEDEAQSETEEKEPNADVSTKIENHGSERSNLSPSGSDIGEKLTKTASQGADSSGPRAVFNVNVTLDSSLDIEKLQTQLELLKHFGAI